MRNELGSLSEIVFVLLSYDLTIWCSPILAGVVAGDPTAEDGAGDPDSLIGIVDVPEKPLLLLLDPAPPTGLEPTESGNSGVSLLII
jgi:hypothetical protein